MKGDPSSTLLHAAQGYIEARTKHLLRVAIDQSADTRALRIEHLRVCSESNMLARPLGHRAGSVLLDRSHDGLAPSLPAVDHFEIAIRPYVWSSRARF